MNKGFRALIVSPTRELAKQTFRYADQMSNRKYNLHFSIDLFNYLLKEKIKYFYRECTRLCEGIGLRAHTFTKINKDKEKFNPKLAQKFGKHHFYISTVLLLEP